MWEVDNETPFAAERGWARDRDGAEVWLVAVKATFDIHADGSTSVAAEQPPVLRAPEYLGEPGASSIRYEADLVPAKRRTDIVVLGHAWAPEGRPVTALDVGFRVGGVSKRLRVFGDRAWGALGPGAPASFTKMPLVYERAFGGVDRLSPDPGRDWDWRNPVGRGYAVRKDHLDGTALPNVEAPDHLIGSWSDRPPPAGFGPLASHWQPRAAHAGTCDERWLRERYPLPPEDFDERFFQYAPLDQQAPGFLTGGEAAALVNLSPGGSLRFRLPRLRLGFETRFYDGSHEFHRQRQLHGVILEPDFPRVSLVWHSALPCHFKVQKLDRTIVTLKTSLNPDRPLPATAAEDEWDGGDEQ
ncbi:DUF2169 family type VI secretion system accessory protein [Pseudoduganella namucuonensis]|uniref:DUF2169 domain-containing protein n=1 Tax=Pseudoduganella namucuonensis TaxID=1035707 RepID=A0A1I7KPT7_9BURK|nr:DUF2169 domain-containing protein [Pseudoduganella namucuonensis]SFU99429.1 hypothetical protein SAMN05216552_1018110 [Pseudoduganella namucuonensis]